MEKACEEAVSPSADKKVSPLQIPHEGGGWRGPTSVCSTWFNKQEEEAIQKNNDKYYRSNAITDIFRQCFRETDTNEPYSRYMSSGDVYEHLCRMYKKAMCGITYELRKGAPYARQAGA